MKRYLERNDVDRIVDRLIDITDSQIDSYCTENEGDCSVDTLEKIRKVSIQRSSYKKLRNALLKEMIGDKANE